MIIRRNRVGGGHGGGNTGLVYFDDVWRVTGVVGINTWFTGVDVDVERFTGVVGIIAGTTEVEGDVERVTGVVGIIAGTTEVEGEAYEGDEGTPCKSKLLYTFTMYFE